MPTIKHTNKTGETCSKSNSPLAEGNPLYPLPPSWGRLSYYSAAFSSVLAKAGGKPFVYFIIVGYLADADAAAVAVAVAPATPLYMECGENA